MKHTLDFADEIAALADEMSRLAFSSATPEVRSFGYAQADKLRAISVAMYHADAKRGEPRGELDIAPIVDWALKGSP